MSPLRFQQSLSKSLLVYPYKAALFEKLSLYRPALNHETEYLDRVHSLLSSNLVDQVLLFDVPETCMN